MLTIWTGAPGSGKTAALVDLLDQLHKKGRPIYVHRPKFPSNEDVTPFSDGLKIPHTPIEADEWHQVVPDGSVIVVDEVQDVWRARGPSVKVPDAVMALETHRHRGIDIFCTTQQPNLIDKNVRALCGRHVHLRDLGVLGRYWYEWPEVSVQLAWKVAPVKRKYKLPASAFKLYKSASLHVKPIRSFPKMLIVAGLAVLALGVTAFFAYRSISGKIRGTDTVKVAGPGVQAPPGSATGASGAVGKASVPPITGQALLAAAVPRVYDRPETAPMYDDLRKVVHMPRVQGGYCQGQSCTCYLQGGIKAPMSVEACRTWLSNPPFDPYYKPDVAAPGGAAAGSPAPASPAQPAQVPAV